MQAVSRDRFGFPTEQLQDRWDVERKHRGWHRGRRGGQSARRAVRQLRQDEATKTLPAVSVPATGNSPVEHLDRLLNPPVVVQFDGEIHLVKGRWPNAALAVVEELREGGVVIPGFPEVEETGHCGDRHVAYLLQRLDAAAGPLESRPSFLRPPMLFIGPGAHHAGQ